MKTIIELKNEGKISNRVYNAILRYAAIDINYICKYKSLDRINGRTIDTDEVLNLTVKDLFDMLSEERIAHWRGLCQKRFKRIKGFNLTNPFLFSRNYHLILWHKHNKFIGGKMLCKTY